SRTGNDQSVQIVTCAICGICVTFVIVKRVVCAVVCGELKSTSKYGSSSVAAGAVLISQLSSLSVVDGPAPVKNAAPAGALGATVACCIPANAEPAIRRVATMAHTKSFFIIFSYTSMIELRSLRCLHSPSLDDTITSGCRMSDSI